MFARFIDNNSASDRVTNLNIPQISRKEIPDQLNMFIGEYGGTSFSNGLYRIHSLSSSYYWETIISNYFHKYKNQIIPFGFDWMGRQFAIDINVSDRILMFDPATAEDFELHESLEIFHNVSLVDDRLDTLSEDTFGRALRFLKKHKIDFNACIGYKKPLFLGGLDAVENYEITDLEVYWETQSQIYHQIKDLPPGTKIDKVSFE